GGRAVEQLAREIEATPRWNCELAAVVRGPAQATPGLRRGLVQRDATWEALDRVVAGLRPDAVIYDLEVRRSRVADEALLRLRLSGVEVVSLPDFGARHAGRVPVHA